MQRRDFLGGLSTGGALLLAGCRGGDQGTTAATTRRSSTARQSSQSPSGRETVTRPRWDVDTSFTEARTASGTTVEFDTAESAFSVAGSVRTHCTVDPVLASTSFDADRDRLTVVVGTDPPKPPTNVNCYYSPVYDYEFVFDGDSLPDTVAVRYRNVGNPADSIGSRPQTVVETRTEPRPPLPVETTLRKSHYPADGLRETAVRYDEDAGTVTVVGGVRGGCNTTPQFEVAGYDGRTLRIVVSPPSTYELPSTYERTSTAYVDCSRFPTFDYELTLAFEDRLPRRVTVQYESVAHPADSSDTISVTRPDTDGSRSGTV